MTPHCLKSTRTKNNVYTVKTKQNKTSGSPIADPKTMARFFFSRQWLILDGKSFLLLSLLLNSFLRTQSWEILQNYR